MSTNGLPIEFIKKNGCALEMFATNMWTHKYKIYAVLSTSWTFFSTVSNFFTF